MHKISLLTLTVVLILYSGMTEASEIEFKEWEVNNFKKLDTDSNGSIDSTEMRGATKKWMNNLGWDEKRQIKATNNKFKKYDVNKDQKVSLEELVIGNRKERKRKKMKEN